METNQNPGGQQQGDGVNQQGAGSRQQEKIFTQDEVNRIVQERLARAKAQQEPGQKEQELAQRENDLYIREQVAAHGFPADIAGELKGLDKGTVDRCIKILKPYIDRMNEPIMNPVRGTRGIVEPDSIRQAMGLAGRKA